MKQIITRDQTINSLSNSLRSIAASLDGMNTKIPVSVVQSQCLHMGKRPGKYSPINMFGPSYYNTISPGVSAYTADEVPEKNIEQLIKQICRGEVVRDWHGRNEGDHPTFPNAPIAFEFSGYTDDKGNPNTTVIQGCAQILSWAHKYLINYGSTSLVGLVDTPNIGLVMDYDGWSQVNVSSGLRDIFRKGIEPFQPIFNKCQFISGGCYPTKQFSRDLIATRRQAEFLQTLFPQLPLFFWISPTYGYGDDNAQPLSPVDADTMLKTINQYFDRAVIWSENPTLVDTVFGSRL